MAIPITDVQGTQVYLAAKGTSVTTAAEAATAISSAKKVAYFMELGDISETRTVTTYSPINATETQKAIGSLSSGNFTINMLYDAADTTGQADFVSMFEDNERRQIIIEMTDDAGTSPSYVTFEIAVSAQPMSFPANGGVMYNSTVEQCSKRVVIKAVA